MPSNPNAVYLTVAYAPYFAFQACKDEERLLFIEVDTDRLKEELLCPDEDFLEQVTRRGDKREAERVLTQRGYQPMGHPEWAVLASTTKENIRLRTEKYREVMHSDYAQFWKKSLETLGNCAYMGAIPVSSITRYALYDALNLNNSVSEITRNIGQPFIQTENYKFCGDFYEKLTQWMFGGNLSWPEYRQWTRYDEDTQASLEKQDRDLFAKLNPDDSYDEARDAVMADLRSHRGVEVYERTGRNKFKLVYKDGSKC